MVRGLFASVMLASTAVLTSSASAQLSIGISVRLAPPPLPVYAQPPLPGPDYLWTPGYWAWDDDVQAYFWVPGTWVRAPQPGLLWTPPWWGWSDGLYLFHTGYWGSHIGFYGGVPYGFGYTGFGYQGGYWNGGHVFYNRTVNNITNVNVTNVYQRNVTVNRVTRVSYNGGPGGVQARASAQEQAAVREQHVAPTGGQQAHVAAAHADPRAFASANHGRPPMAATPRPMGGAGGRPVDAGPGPDGMAAPADRAQRFAGDPGRPVSDGRVGAGAPDRFPRDASASPRTPARPADEFERPDTADRVPLRGAGDPGHAPRAARERPMGEAPPPHPQGPPHQPPHQPQHPHPQQRPPAPHPHPPAEKHEEHR